MVLAVSMAQGLGPEDELWLAFGAGKRFQFLAAGKIAIGLRPKKAQSLPIFHVLPGCDTVSVLLGIVRRQPGQLGKHCQNSLMYC